MLELPDPSQMTSDLDAYFDAAPRWDADAIEAGAFTLFVGRAAFGYYARPAVRHRGPIGPDDLAALEKVCAERDVPLEIEWVAETHPELAEIAATYGLETRSHALMVASAGDVETVKIEGVTIRIADPEEAAIKTGRAVADVSFIFGGTGVGANGPTQRDERTSQQSPELIAHLRERGRQGRTITAVAEDAGGVLATGSYQPTDGRAEILAVATLPSARRRGIAGALTGLLARHALDNGVHTVLLSAQDDDVARVYKRIGFRRVGATGAAENPEE